MEQVQENIRIADSGIANSLDSEDKMMFDRLRNALGVRAKADCTACRYCMPCKSGVDIPYVIAALNNAALWNDPNPWMTGYVSIKGKAGKCTECRECEEVCPQELPVSSLMKEALALFKS
jgi:hypothetical protein